MVSRAKAYHPGDTAIIFMCQAYEFHGASKMGHAILVIIRGTLESAEAGFAAHLFDTLLRECFEKGRVDLKA
jgi:hypothetical protein